METENADGSAGGEWSIELAEFSVVLIARPIDPSILNPDFLHHNEIVDAGRQAEDPRISTPAFSQVSFAGGLTIAAEPERLIFAQSGNGLSHKDIECPEMVKRYVRQFSHIYRAVGINSKGFSRREGKIAEALIDEGTWMSFNDVAPDVQLKAIYRYPGRTISLEFAGPQPHAGDDRGRTGISFQANIHRDITEVNQKARIERLLTIVDSWRSDLSDFRALVARFNPRRS